MDCRKTRKQLSAFLDGEVAPADAQEIQAHLNSCPACHDERIALERTARSVRALPRMNAPADLKARVMEEAARSRVGELEETPASKWRLYWPAAATVLIAAGIYLYTNASPREARRKSLTRADLAANKQRQASRDEPGASVVRGPAPYDYYPWRGIAPVVTLPVLEPFAPARSIVPASTIPSAGRARDEMEIMERRIRQTEAEMMQAKEDAFADKRELLAGRLGPATPGSLPVRPARSGADLAAAPAPERGGDEVVTVLTPDPTAAFGQALDFACNNGWLPAQDRARLASGTAGQRRQTMVLYLQRNEIAQLRNALAENNLQQVPAWTIVPATRRETPRVELARARYSGQEVTLIPEVSNRLEPMRAAPPSPAEAPYGNRVIVPQVQKAPEQAVILSSIRNMRMPLTKLTLDFVRPEDVTRPAAAPVGAGETPR